MPLVLETLETALENIYLGNVPNADATQKAQAKTMATQMATAIDTYIKSATITVPAGVLVQVAVPAGTGATTGPGIATIE